MPEFFTFVYPPPGRKGRVLPPSIMRDSVASDFLQNIIRARGFTFGGAFFNFAAAEKGVPVTPEGRNAHVALVPSAADLLVMNTRPPMDDDEVNPRRPIYRSYNETEVRLFARNALLRRCFKRCSRNEVILTNEAASISPATRERKCMVIRQNQSDAYSSYGPDGVDWTYPAESEVWTPAFLVYGDAWPGGPKLLAAFGMGGASTLVWSEVLTKRFPELVFTHEFVMAELRGPWPKHPCSTAFVDPYEMEVRILGAAPTSIAA